MNKPLIGITSGENKLFETTDFNGSPISYTLTNVTDAVIKAGGIPVIIPVHDVSLSQAYIETIDGLLLAGGADVVPYYYSEDQSDKLGKTDAKRDIRELALVDAAIKQQLPLLGICRGLQIMNVYLGGTLYQDLSYMPNQTFAHDQIAKEQEIVHDLKIAPNSRYAKLTTGYKGVNSIHHQAIHKLSKHLKKVAWSSDGVVEAAESSNKEIDFIGVQYHPESLIDHFPEHLVLFTDLVKRATKKRQEKYNTLIQQNVYTK